MTRLVIPLLLLLLQIGVVFCGYSEEFLSSHNKKHGRIESTKWDVGFDCKIKKLAFEYAKKLSPGTGSDLELNLIFKGLQLGALCNESFNQQHFEYPWSKPEKESKAATTAVVFVDKSHGKNNYQGTIAKPLFDIQSGVDRCFSKIQAVKSVKNCIVNVRQGIYEIDKPLKLHSNIELANFKSEKVTISGFKTVKPTWKQHVLRTDHYENLNPIFETVIPMKSSDKIQYFGKTTTSTQCESNCDKLSHCSSYVYFDKSNKDFGNQCYGRLDGIWNPVATNGTVSGKKVYKYFKEKKIFHYFFPGKNFCGNQEIYLL